MSGRIVLDCARPKGLTVDIERSDGKPSCLYLRPFSMLDEAWLATFLEASDGDLFGVKDNNPSRLAGTFLHQLDEDSRAEFVKELGLDFDSDTHDVDWLKLGAEIAEKLNAKEIMPLQKSMVILRDLSLPDIPESTGGHKAPLGKLFGTLMFISLCGNLAWALMALNMLPV